MIEWAHVVLSYLPFGIFLLVYTCVAAVYIKSEKKDSALTEHDRVFVTLLFGGVANYLIFIALLKSVLQFIVWSQQGGFGMLLLSLPLKESLGGGPLVALTAPFFGDHGYFLFYILTRFWSHALLSLLLGFLVISVLSISKRLMPQAFSWLEIGVAGILVLLLGWELFVPFIVFSLSMLLTWAVVRAVGRREAYVSLGYALLLAAPLVLVLSSSRVLPYVESLFPIFNLHLR